MCRAFGRDLKLFKGKKSEGNRINFSDICNWHLVKFIRRQCNTAYLKRTSYKTLFHDILWRSKLLRLKCLRCCYSWKEVIDLRAQRNLTTTFIYIPFKGKVTDSIRYPRIIFVWICRLSFSHKIIRASF